MRGLICDLCGNQANGYYSEHDWTTINLGIKLIGYKDYQDLCPSCTVWLISKLAEGK